jgi:hypothetical protein
MKDKKSQVYDTIHPDLAGKPDTGVPKKAGRTNIFRKFLNWLAAGAEKDRPAQACSQ